MIREAPRPGRVFMKKNVLCVTAFCDAEGFLNMEGSSQVVSFTL